MPRTMTTDWEIIATSGKTIDDRIIEKVWLTDMAETYNPKVYSSRIYLDHERWFGAQGKVVELKTEPATDPDLKGEIHLFAKLCPSDDLVYANRRGRYVHSSIEVKKNFRGTGKYYLGGLAVTDEPASVGTSELQFSENSERLIIAGPQLNFSTSDNDFESENEENTLVNLFRKLINKDKGDSQETAMDQKQFSQLVETQTKTNQLLETMIGKFSEQKPGKTGKEADEQPDDENTEFVSKKDHDELKEQFSKLQEQFTKLENTPAGGTKTDDDSGQEDKCI